VTIHTHTFSASLSVRDEDQGGDGRTLVGLAVPYDEELEVSDFWDEYTEVFRKGAFAKTITDRAQPVPLLVAHEHRTLPIGAATTLAETDAGLEAQFHLSATARADEVLELVRDRAISGLSIGFQPVQQRVTKGSARDPAAHRDLVERTEVNLREVSICNFPAFAGAGVTGVRTDRGSHPSLGALALERARLETARANALDRWGRVVRS
jgi:uncharacterized protein